MASVIDTHPQRQKIIDGILAGLSLRDIAASVTPSVSIMAIQRYRQKTVAPAMANASVLAKVMQENGVQTSTGELTQLGETAVNVTRSALMAAPILAVRENRLAALQDRHDRLAMVLAERAEDMAEAPGGRSGLLVRKQKIIGSGLLSREVTEYELDTGLLSEFREHEKQAAMELGQWQENARPAGPDLTVQLMVSIPRYAPQQVQPSVDVQCRTIEAAHTAENE